MNRILIRRATLALISVTLLLAAFATWLFAAAAPTATKTSEVLLQTPNDVKMEKVGENWLTVYTKVVLTQEDATFTADRIEQLTQKKDVHVFTCTGNPVYKAPENTITSDTVIANSSPRSADFSGNVKAIHSSSKKDESDKLLESGTTVVTSQRLIYDYGKKWAEFTGGEVTMLYTPLDNVVKKDDLKGEFKKAPSTLTCDKLNYDYANKKALAVGAPGRQVHIVQKERDCWADQATYDENTNLVVLKGNFVMQNKGEEELKSILNVDTVTISLDNEWILMKPIPGKVLIMKLLVKE